ncbi:fimbrillin family protein [Bacteroides fragilis]
MKAKLVALSMAAVALAMAGCSNDENEEMDNWNGEIRLSSGVAVQTRANTQAEQIQSGETVYAWVDKATTGESYINAWTLTAQGNGSFKGNSKYYPTDGSTLDFYALHGNFASGAFTEDATAFPETDVVHLVEADQSDEGMKNYAKSDLLYAVKKGVKRGSDAVKLEFYHMLSKVEVALKSGDGNPDLTDAIVTIEGTKLKARFRPDKDTGQQRADMITIVDNDNDPISIKIRTVVTEDFDKNTEYAEAILVPNQELKRNATFINVLPKGGSIFSYKIPENLTLESGKKYTYKITVNQSGLSVSSDIKNWDPVGDAKEGEATMD